MPSFPLGIFQNMFVSLCETSRISCTPAHVTDAQNTPLSKISSILHPPPATRRLRDRAGAVAEVRSTPTMPLGTEPRDSLLRPSEHGLELARLLLVLLQSSQSSRVWPGRATRSCCDQGPSPFTGGALACSFVK